MNDFYDRMPWFLKDHIVRNEWKGFREVQEKSFEVLFNSDDHLLITSGTSSGKTEAAMFPVLTSLYSKPPKSIGALYISPLKALIDDQFDRMDDIIRDAEIKVTSWHGDVSQSIKRGLMRNPSGIMQTTPESLQSLIMNHWVDVPKMFSELRFIIIDEVHAFMNSTRGLQLLCEFESLMRMAGCNPRRIGLSATLSDMSIATEWLGSNSDRHVTVVESKSSSEYTIDMLFHRFPSGPKFDDDEETKKAKDEQRTAAIMDYYYTLFNETDPYNCIVFSNSRLGAEKLTRGLRALSRKYSGKDVEIHHGSISKEIRKHSEERIKNSERNVTLVSTSTLELGIDIGDLDRVVQRDPPHTSSSFVQRMGRSGRRTGKPVMKLICTMDDDYDNDHPLRIPINLVKGIALVELFRNERWVEPTRYSSRPYGLLYQQTMGYMKPLSGTTFGDLCKDVLSMYPFRNITVDEYKIIIKHLIEIGHLGLFEGSLVIQSAGEKVVNNIDFLATFTDDNKYEVVCDGTLVGYLPKRPMDNSKVLLAGKSWKVLDVKNTEVSVIGISEEAQTKWDSGEPSIHKRVMKEIQKIIKSDTKYPYLDESAEAMMDDFRKFAMEQELATQITIPIENIINIRPWTGSIQFDTINRIISKMKGVKILNVIFPFQISISTKMGMNEFKRMFNECASTIDPYSLIMKEDTLDYEKFDEFIPRSLLRKKFITERMDLAVRL